MKKIILVVLFVCGACFLGGGPYQLSPRAGEQDSKLVKQIWYNPIPENWKNSMWFKPEYDMITPTRIVISSDNYACIMGNEVIEPQINDYYVCLSKWRFPRGR